MDRPLIPLAPPKPLPPDRHGYGPDWEAIEREWRAGRLSVQELARQHKLSPARLYKRAKEYRWIRDRGKDVLAHAEARVIEATAEQDGKAKALKNALPPQQAPDYRTKKARADAAYIAAAGEQAAQVMLRHREEMRALVEVEEKLLADLRRAPVLGENVDGLPMSESLLDRARAFGILVASRTKRLEIERRIWRIDKLDAINDDGDKPRYVVAMPPQSVSVEMWATPQQLEAHIINTEAVVNAPEPSVADSLAEWVQNG